MVGIFNSSIFNNAIFNTDSGVVEETPATGGWASDSYIQRENERYRQAKQAKEQRENQIIEAKLEQQELLNKKRDLLAEKNKQNARQIAALEREISAKAVEVQKMQALLQAAIEELIYQHNLLATILLMDSDPFFAIGGHSHTIH
jgi:hypothetical protein